MSDRPRLLIATPITQSKLYVFDEWVEGIRNQETDLPFDVLLVDNTDFPAPGYVDWIRDWAKSEPFGHQHRIRLKRFGYDVDGQMFFTPIMKVGYGERIVWNLLAGEDEHDESVIDEDTRPTSMSPIEFAARWASYSHLLSLECDVIMPPHAIQTLYESKLPWAASWMLSRELQDPRYPGVVRKLPLLWHSLDPQHYANLEHDASDNDMDKFEWLASLGYYEPPTSDPFPVTVSHLGCTLIDTEVIRTVPFRYTYAGGDVTYSWDVAANGIQPHCVPAVACDHIAAHERPAFAPWNEQPAQTNFAGVSN